MNRRAIWAIVRKDLMVVRQNKGVLIPLIVVPLIMLVLLPGLAGFAPLLLVDVPGSPIAGLDLFLEGMPDGMQEQLEGYDEAQSVVVLALVYFLAPMYLILPAGKPDEVIKLPDALTASSMLEGLKKAGPSTIGSCAKAGGA